MPQFKTTHTERLEEIIDLAEDPTGPRGTKLMKLIRAYSAESGHYFQSPNGFFSDLIHHLNENYPVERRWDIMTGLITTDSRAFEP